MPKVTVILGPQSSGKSHEVEKIINDRPAMHVGSMSVFGLRNDPFYLTKLLIKAASIGKGIVVIEEAVEGIREILLVLVLTGQPVDVVICSNSFLPADIQNFEPYIAIIDLWKRS